MQTLYRRQIVPGGRLSAPSRVPFSHSPVRQHIRQWGITRASEEASVTKSVAEETTEKYGLEAGLVQVMTSKDAEKTGLSRTEQAKQLLAQYGSAYLITSISFAIVSFAACYAAVSAGVDVGALLSRMGLSVSDTSEKVGTFAIAYAAHKALSPVRFPPTVALTPVVAKWFGKKKEQQAADAAASNGSSGGDGDGSSPAQQ